MIKKWMIIGISAGLVFTSCGGGEENKEENAETKDTEKVEECFYSYDPSSTVVTWTAFKFTDKTGVNGKFDNISVSNVTKSNDLSGALANATFVIPISTINSENPDRDMKIKEQFFGTMMNTDRIEGKLISWSRDTNAGLISLTMNGVEKEVNVIIEFEGEKATLTTTIDVYDFNANTPLANLNAVCEELHTGLDGVSKLWNEVEIKVETTLLKECE